MDFMPLRLNSSSLTYSICALVAIILQFVAMECNGNAKNLTRWIACILVRTWERQLESSLVPWGAQAAGARRTGDEDQSTFDVIFFPMLLDPNAFRRHTHQK